MLAVPLESLSTSSELVLPSTMYDFLPRATSQVKLRRFEWIYGMAFGEFQYSSPMNIVQVAPDIHKLMCLNPEGFTIVPPVDVIQELKKLAKHNHKVKRVTDRLCVFDIFPRDALYEYTLVPLGRSKGRQALYSHLNGKAPPLRYWKPSQTVTVTSRAHPICVSHAATEEFCIVSEKNLLKPHRNLQSLFIFMLPAVIRPPVEFCPLDTSENDAFSDASRDDDRLELGSDRSNPEDNVRLLQSIPPVPDLVESSSQSSSQPESTLSDLPATGTRKRKSTSSHSSGRSKDSSEMGINDKADRKRVELAKRNRRRVISWSKSLREREEDLADDEVDDLSSRYAVEYSRPPEDVLSKPQLARR